MSSAPVILVLGAGPGVGAQTAMVFAAKGYRIALAARSLRDGVNSHGHAQFHVDSSNPEKVTELFAKVKREVGVPSVVLYNAYSRSLVPPNDPLSTLDLNEYHRDIAVNITSAIVAAKEAVLGFRTLPEDAARTFIYTGNKLNVMPDPKCLAFGIARTGIAHMIWDCSVAYRNEGIKFYFTDERLADGTPSRELMDPHVRAELHMALAEQKQGPWHYTFVKDSGYVDFRSVDRAWEV